ncbi:hypothetical protein PSAB6_50107 [Paraburkholderia sabiae]|nr:hypothetical protein PSAB6_50107 [Paraburkholderia sabiae]
MVNRRNGALVVCRITPRAVFTLRNTPLNEPEFVATVQRVTADGSHALIITDAVAREIFD